MNCRREKAGLPVDDEQEYLPLSWLSQADYCLRRAALLLNERVWVENVETAKGRAEHERVHTQRVERRGDFVKLYENSVFSDEMQISGKCDCIEAVRDENGEEKHDTLTFSQNFSCPDCCRWSTSMGRYAMNQNTRFSFARRRCA